MTYDAVIAMSLRNRASGLADTVLADNPLLARISKHVRDRETDKWLSGATDVSMGISWTQHARDMVREHE